MKPTLWVALAAALAAAPARAEPNLVAHYTFDDCTATDLSGNANHGKLVGNVTCAPGTKGSGLKFGGLGSAGYVEIPASPSLAAVDDITYSMWFRIDQYLSQTGGGEWTDYGLHALFAKEGDRTGLDLRTSRRPTGELYLWASNGYCCGDMGRASPSFGSFGLNEWHLATVTAGGGVLKLYFDGVLQATTSLANFPINPIMANQPLRLGVDEWASCYPLGGMLDEVRVYDRALTDAEVATLFLPIVPRANAGPDQVLECPATPWANVALDGSGSVSAEGDALSYLWTWSDGTATHQETGVAPTITVPTWGTYEIGLQVTDAYGLGSTDSTTVVVGDTRAPKTTASVVGTRAEDGVYTSEVEVTLTSKDACTGVAAIHYTINGEEHVYQVSPPAPTASTTFKLTTDGTYVITFWAVDAAGRESPRTEVPPLPVAPAPAPGGGGQGGYYPSCVSVTLVSLEGGAYYTRDGGVTWLPYDGTFQVCGEAANQVSYGYAEPNANVEPVQTIVIVVDVSPPVLVLPANVVAEATSPTGAPVTYVVTATDAIDASPVVSCSPASGSTFPFGTTTVACAARDASGREAAGSFTVTVVDTTPPVITILGVAHGATYALGLVPAASYAVTDSGSGVAAASATTTEGTLGLGQSTYAVAAKDLAGNPASASATYTVVATIPGLEALVRQYQASGDITDPALATALLEMLANARNAPTTNERDGWLQDFASQVRSQSSKKITVTPAARMENAARYVIANP